MATIKICLFLVLLYSIPATSTTTVFHTSCTRPDSSFNFVDAPNIRGTLEILWSCLFTLFVCTWTVQHSDMIITHPRLFRYSEEAEKLVNKLAGSVLTLFAPEVLVAKAYLDFERARSSVRKMQELQSVEKGSWTMTHAFYANMGGFLLREKALVGEPDPTEYLELQAIPKKTYPTTNNSGEPPPPAKSDDQVLVGIASNTVTTTKTTATTSGTNPRRLNSVQILTCLETGLLSSPLNITERDIQRNSRGDILLKCITVMQVLWFIVQVSARIVLNIPTSQLEIAVLAFSVGPLMGYLFWWKKPLDVSVTTYLNATRILSTTDTEKLDEERDFDLGLSYDIIGRMMILGGTIFGAFHFLAWNSHFPSPAEKIIWRISAIILTAYFPTVTLLAQTCSSSMTFVLGLKRTTYLERSVLVLSSPFYILCRGFIIVESFRSLGYLEGGCFLTSWSTYLPHVT